MKKKKNIFNRATVNIWKMGKKYCSTSVSASLCHVFCVFVFLSLNARHLTTSDMQKTPIIIIFLRCISFELDFFIRERERTQSKNIN